MPSSSFRGGRGSRQANSFGDEGKTAVQVFVKDGGSYCGVCAGSYLATTDYTWSLGLLNAKVVDRDHWGHGTGTVTLDFTPEGRKFLRVGEKRDVFYGQRPLLATGGKTGDGVPAPYEELATYKTEIAENGALKGVMVGTTAIARGRYGKGKVLCYSPHPETDGPGEWILHGMKWLAETGADTPKPMVDK